MVTALIYRSFRRRVLLATAVLFGLGLLAAITLRQGGGLWTVTMWTAICSPLVVTIGIALLLPLGPTAARLGLREGRSEIRMRPTAMFWMIAAIVLPWMGAWLVADLAGNWYMAWHYQAQAAGDSGVLLWTTRLLAGLLTYSLASAVGVLLTFLFDRHLHAGTEDQPS